MSDARAKGQHTWERTINADIEDVWRAFTDPDEQQQGVYDHIAESTWMPGEPVRFLDGDGTCVIEGVITDVDPPHRLVHTFAYTAAGLAAAKPDASSRVTWMMEPDDDCTHVVLVHDGLNPDGATFGAVEDSWEHVLDGLGQLFDAEDGDDD
ncbi:MAG: SRPBCC domain-containing protein [Gaiellales bacterium]